MQRSRMRSNAAFAVLLPSLLATTGCGLLITTAPPRNHESLPMFYCTESNVGPGLDAVWAGMMFLNAGLTASRDDEYGGTRQRHSIIVMNVGLGLLSAISSGAGFDKTKRCRRAKELMMLRLSEGSSRPQVFAFPESMQVDPISDPMELGERIDQERLRLVVGSEDR